MSCDACKWALRKTFRRSPTPDELRDYKLALDERDRLGLRDALPIFSRLRSEASAKAVRRKRQWQMPETGAEVAATAIESSAAPAAPQSEAPAPSESEPSKPEPPQTDHANMAASVPAPAGDARPRVKERAEAFLREQLANGPAPGECVKAAAAEAKVSERFLIAAAERLGVRTQRGQRWLPNRVCLFTASCRRRASSS